MQSTLDFSPNSSNTMLAVRAGKSVEVYGIEMTSLQEIMFSKYLSNNGIAMNTKTKEERTKIVLEWLNK